jgi:S1-C subfamily serine protease
MLPAVWPDDGDVHSPPPPPPPTGARSGGPSPILLGALAGVAVLVVGVGVLLLLLRGGDDDPSVGASTTTTPQTTATVPVASSEPPTTVAAPPSVDDLARAVVQVQLLDDAGEIVCSGSGTLISPDGRILTNAHVVENDDVCPYVTIGVAITEQTDEPPRLTYAADVLTIDRSLDLAVIGISSTLDGDALDRDLPTMEIGDSDAVALGDTIRIFGFPGIGGETITFTNGAVSGYVSEGSFGARAWMKTDATIAGGNSGGAAVDAAGQLIGVPTQAGAGASDVVDCRIITDSNGDGQVDDADTCVPLGGFINGLRPVRLALDLIEQSETADPLDILPPTDEPGGFDPASVEAFDPFVTTGVDADGNPGPTVLAAPSGTTDLCVFFSFTGMADGVDWDGIWLFEGEPDDDASLVGQIWNSGSEGTYYICIGNPDGLSDGLYELVFSVESDTIFGESAWVGGERFPVDIVVRNSSGVTICYVDIAPGPAGYWGLDHLGTDEVIEDGAERTFTVASGDQAVQVSDCGREVLYSDDGGDVTEPIVIDVTG